MCTHTEHVDALARRGHAKGRLSVALAGAMLWASLVGCEGQIDDTREREVLQGDSPSSGSDPGNASAADDPSGVAGGAAALECEQPTLGESGPFRRLTRDEYDNTVRDLLGDDSAPGRAFPQDEEGLGFGLGATVSTLQLELYGSAAESLAARAMSRIDEILPCDPASRDRSCVEGFIRTFGLRAYRAPLEQDQLARLLGVYDAAVEGGGTIEDGVRLVLTAMLQSPSFLYRVELGAEDRAGVGAPSDSAVVRLSPYELAARLSYFLWGSMPDDTLFDAAELGALVTKEDVAREARRMLEDPRARESTLRFYRSWLGTELEGVVKDEALYPEYDEALARSMQAETERFVSHVLFEGEGDLGSLLNARYTFVDERLAEHYGIAGVRGDELVQVDLDGRERAGILTQGAMLAHLATPTQSSPVERGAFVRQQLFCQPLPPPPDDLVVVPPEPDPTLTTRERYEQHRADPACAGCHRLMDPIGFAFELYDATGKHRETENGLPIDASGEIVGTDTTDGTFEGVVELADRLAASEDVRSCVVRQWFRFAFGRLEGDADACSVARMREDFAGAGYDLRELMVAATQTDAFLYRREASGTGSAGEEQGQ